MSKNCCKYEHKTPRATVTTPREFVEYFYFGATDLVARFFPHYGHEPIDNSPESISERLERNILAIAFDVHRLQDGITKRILEKRCGRHRDSQGKDATDIAEERGLIYGQTEMVHGETTIRYYPGPLTP